MTVDPELVAVLAMMPFTFRLDDAARKAMTAVDPAKFLVGVRPREEK